MTVRYTGKPGVHNDGDGTTEGWFRSSDGGFVTTEPVGSEDWMPLNDHPTAKPTYDFYDTVAAGLTAVANGVLKSVTHHAPDARFTGGSTTWHWHSRAPIASYLVENSVGHYTLTARVGSDGIRYYQAQDASISAAQQQKNLAIMNQQQDITDFESQFNGRFPFTSDGIIIGTPDAGFEEEMQTMITFAGGEIDLGTLYHENMHQWWGDNVTEGGYNLTFFKEGMATLGEYLQAARDAETKAGGPGTTAGKKAFTGSLIAQFNKTYARAGSFWTAAPSNPTPFGLFSNAPTYERPGAAYIALWQILGTARFTKALQHIQRHYGGGHITEPQLEAGFRHWLPNKSAACENRLSQFFTQWFDTAYPSGGGDQQARDHRARAGRRGLLRQPRRLPRVAGPAVRRRRAPLDRQRLDRAVEPVPSRAADPRAFQRAVRRAHQVAVLHLGGQPAPDRAGLVHVRRAVEKHHAGIHREPPFPRSAGACRTDDAARPPGRAGLPLTPLQLREGALAESEGRTVRLIHRICRAICACRT